METDTETFFKRTKVHIARLFVDRKFLHYTWIGIFISLLNIFLLWLLIDILDISTLVASTIVVTGTFIFRYILFDVFKILRTSSHS